MDFGSLKVAQISTLKLRHPTTGQLVEGAEIDLYGRDSKPFRKIVADNRRKRMGGAKQDDEAQMGLDTSIALTVAIRGIELDGEPITDAAYLYSIPELAWILDSVQLFVLNLENFMKPT